MKNFLDNATEWVKVKTPSAIVAGEPVFIGDVFGIARLSAKAGELASLSRTGLFQADKVAGEAIALGAPVYWNAASKLYTGVSTGNAWVGAATVQSLAADKKVTFVLQQSGGRTVNAITSLTGGIEFTAGGEVVELGGSSAKDAIAEMFDQPVNYALINDIYGNGATPDLASVIFQRQLYSTANLANYNSELSTTRNLHPRVYEFQNNIANQDKYLSSPYGMRKAVNGQPASSYGAIPNVNQYGTQTLLVALSATDTIVVLSTFRASMLEGDEFYVDSELMTITAVNASDYTVTRGARGTNAASHNAGSSVRTITSNTDQVTFGFNGKNIWMEFNADTAVYSILIDGRPIPASMLGKSNLRWIALRFKENRNHVITIPAAQINRIRTGDSTLSASDSTQTLFKVNTNNEFVQFGDSNSARIYSSYLSGSNPLNPDSVGGNVCEPEKIPATKIEVGKTYAIYAPGTTDFTLCGAEAAVAASSLVVGETYVIVSGGDTDWNVVGGGTAGTPVDMTENATNVRVGMWCVIKTVGTTDFTLIGAASNTVGLTFLATGTGTGTGTIFRSHFTCQAVGTGTGTAQKITFKATAVGTGTGAVTWHQVLMRCRYKYADYMMFAVGKPLPTVGSVGGTGIAAINGGDPDGTNYQERLVFARNNDKVKVLYIYGSGNDFIYTTDEVAAGLRAMFEFAPTRYPNLQAIIVGSVYGGFNTDATVLANFNSMLAQVVSENPMAVILPRQATHTGDDGMWFGTGRFGVATNDGNADLYLGVVGSTDRHCNLQGIWSQAYWDLAKIKNGELI